MQSCLCTSLATAAAVRTHRAVAALQVTLKGDVIQLTDDSDSTQVATVVQSDIEACNGSIVHLVDGTLDPCCSATTCPTTAFTPAQVNAAPEGVAIALAPDDASAPEAASIAATTPAAAGGSTTPTVATTPSGALSAALGVCVIVAAAAMAAVGL
jgi:hypothetical protein